MIRKIMLVAILFLVLTVICVGIERQINIKIADDFCKAKGYKGLNNFYGWRRNPIFDCSIVTDNGVWHASKFYDLEYAKGIVKVG